MQVSVSAWVLTIPDGCACCQGPSDLKFKALNTRTTRNETDTRSLEFPLCSGCLRHAHLFETSLNVVRNSIWIAGALASVFVFFFGGGLPGSYLLTIWGVMVGGGYFIGRMVRDSRQDEAQLTCQPNCGAATLPVVYLHRHGSVHTFGFTNDAYARQFERKNAEKLVA